MKTTRMCKALALVLGVMGLGASAYAFMDNGSMASGQWSSTIENVPMPLAATVIPTGFALPVKSVNEVEALNEFKEVVVKELAANKNWFQNIAALCKREWATIPVSTFIAAVIALVVFIVFIKLWPMTVGKFDKYLYKGISYRPTKTEVKKIGKKFSALQRGFWWILTAWNFTNTDDYEEDDDEKVNKVNSITTWNNIKYIIALLLIVLPIIVAAYALIPAVTFIASWIATHGLTRRLFTYLEKRSLTSKQALEAIIRKINAGTLSVPVSLKSLFDQLPAELTEKQAQTAVETMLAMCNT